MVATEEEPPDTELGARVMFWTPTGSTVRTTDAVEASGAVALSVTGVTAATFVVGMVIVPDTVAPAAIVTDAGTVTAALPDVRFTT